MLRSAQPSQFSTYPSQYIDTPGLAVLGQLRTRTQEREDGGEAQNNLIFNPRPSEHRHLGSRNKGLGLIYPSSGHVNTGQLVSSYTLTERGNSVNKAEGFNEILAQCLGIITPSRAGDPRLDEMCRGFDNEANNIWPARPTHGISFRASKYFSLML